MNVFRKHQIAIARKTLAMPDVMVDVLGGMTKDDARRILGEECAKEYRARYNPVAVNREIAKDKRIGKREAKLIHALLKGRTS